jgi:PKD repeat protein
MAIFAQYNPPPIAEAGNDVNALTLHPIQLDGTQSYDPDTSLISFNWSLFAPAGSSAFLDDATNPLPRLTPDIAGDYQVELIVNDGEYDSEPSQVTVSASDGIAPPNARAGRDQAVLTGSRVNLDGSASYDPNGLSMSYVWSLLQVPSGSGLTNADIWFSDTLHPEFEPDVAGAYDLNLRVTNGYFFDHDSVLVQVSDPNVAPTAEAGPSRATRSGEIVYLDGSGSHDPDAGPDALSHSWSFVARPDGSGLTTADIVDFDQPIANFTPDVPGVYIIRVNVDDGELQAGDNTTVITDDTPPDVSITSPVNGEMIDTTTPTITVTFDDAQTGIDLSSFQLLVNGADVTGATKVKEASATYTPVVDLPGGENEVTVRIADNAGNLAEAVSLFNISIFRAIADCGPTLGTAPLTVTYRSRGIFTEGSIVRYRWDRDGNGSYDTYDTVPRDYSYTFNSPGAYNAVLEVQNNLGQIATDVCPISVELERPTVTASATPSNGSVPLEVTFICQGQSPNGPIVLWEWDLDGNGAYEYSSSVSGTTTSSYDTVGEYPVTCRVTDSVGMSGVSGVIDTTVRPRPEGSPSVTATATPTSGFAPLVVNFNGSVIDDGVIVLYEWDFDGDGVYDYSSTTSAAISHTYQSAGIFAATLRVTDDVGLSSLDAIAIDVDVTASLSIADDTFLPDIGETATVATSVSGTVQTRLHIRDNRGVYVRTLVDEQRTAGTYSDVWDGRNDAGDLLPDGDYYAILEYDVGGETRLIDLTYTTGGVRYNPPRTSLPSRFDPYENDPLPITFTVPANQGASEILAFVGLFYTNTRLVTLLDREPFGVGTHTIYWDGLLPDGSLAVPPPGDTFLFGIWGYTLPNNAIYLSSAPHISNFAVHPTLHSPARDGSRPLQVTFDLDKDSDMELSVENLATGRLVFTGRYPGYTAGAGKVLEWSGLNSNGFLPDKGEYRLALTAIDSSSGTSITRYILLRIFY